MRFEAVVDRGLELLGPGIKEENEVLDLVMRAALRCGKETDDAVLDLARRWREFVRALSLTLCLSRCAACRTGRN